MVVCHVIKLYFVLKVYRSLRQKMARRGKKRSVHGLDGEDEMVTVGDIAVAGKLVPGDCEPWLNDTFTTETLYSVLSTPESTNICCA